MSKKVKNENQNKSDNFQKNLEAILEKNALLAAKVLSISENKKYEVFQGSDPVDINIIDKERNIPLYSSAVEDTVAKFHEIEDKNTLNPYLYFFGIGNGILMKMILGNEKHKRVVVIEPEIELLYIALNFADFSSEIRENRFQIFLAEDFSFPVAEMMISFNDARIYSKVYTLDLTLPYYSVFQEDVLKVNNDIIKAINHIIIGHGNDAIDSLIGVEHHTKNLPTMLKNPKFKELIKHKNAETCVIVSAGPSLNKQLELLKEVQDSVTIMCVDSTLPIVTSNGIKPDIVCSMERDELTAKFFEKTPEEKQEGVIFLSASLQHETLLRAIKKGTRILAMRPFKYSKYFELEDYGYVCYGMSAANMAHELAIFMGYKNCILIGQDLAYSKDGKQSHTKGHILGEDFEFKHTFDEVYLDAYGGEGKVRSHVIWKMFLNFFEKNIFDIKDRMKTINATEGGARIGGAIEMPFKEVCERVIDRNHKKSQIEVPYPTKEEYEKALAHANRKIDDMLEVGQRVKDKVEGVFLDVAKACEELENLNDNNKLEHINFEKLSKLVDDIDEVKAIFEEDIEFINIFFYAIQSYIIHQELELAKVQISNPKDDMGKKSKMIDWIMKHKYWLFSLAGGIDAQIEVMKRSRKEMIFDL